MAKNVHVVFGIYSKLKLEDSFLISEQLAGEVICLGDDLRIGPIRELDTSVGLINRKKWFETVGDDTIVDYFNIQGSSDHKTIESIKQILLEGQVIHIWYGNNSFDLLSLGRLLHAIQSFVKQIILAPISKHVFIDLGKWEFIAESLGVLRTEQVQDLEQYFRNATEQDLKVFSGIWSTASQRQESLRMVNAEGIFREDVPSQINQVLLSFCKKEFQKSALVIGESFVALNYEAADSTLNWMLKMLVITGKLEARGTLRMMRDYEVRLL
ncbi:MAG: DUF1835 domain-containing protein [Pedobacter sp.]|nr:MAG: DUF1835 domain-containing protein [Pedobacter sp.]